MRRCLQSLDALQLSPVEPNVPASATADGLRVGSLPIHNSSVPRSQQLQEALTRQAAVSCGEFQAQVASLSVHLLAAHCTSAHTDEVVVRYSCGIDRLSGNRVYSCVVRRAGHPSGPYPLAAHPAADARKVRPILVLAGEHCTHPHAHGDIGAGTSRSLRSRASRCVCAWHG